MIHQAARRLRESEWLLSLGVLSFILLACLPEVTSHTTWAQDVQPTLFRRNQITIQGGDLLSVVTFEEKDLSAKVRVDSDGSISLPLIGMVQVAGNTPERAAALISKSFETHKVLLHPQVSVLVSEYATGGVSIIGEVKKPGVYQLLGSHTLLDAISTAGGLTPEANTTVLIRRRGEDNETVSVHLLLQNARISADNDVPVYPNDLVVVPQAGLVYVLGDVGKPGGFTLRSDGQLTVLEALSQAQGTNKTASIGDVKLLRRLHGGQVQQINLPLKKMQRGRAEDVALQPDDVIYVPSSTLKSSAGIIAGLGGAVATAVIYSH